MGVEMTIQPHCIVVGSTVTSLCGEIDKVMKCTANMKIERIPQQSHINLRKSHDHKHHHGKLVKTDVAKCSE
ncbi:hypothetical protein KIN20_025891 [Parelaphostrongylus tenuis]|uniref:Uncharacterized protein n=1 Tax=Parelaphostrongylus tenuis TaxID=148309 RepID=A0AAD5QWV0_PARTN|nr:hypothetical protein KIN20_025891 [Parelaphostrongylus tenuis]